MGISLDIFQRENPIQFMCILTKIFTHIHTQKEKEINDLKREIDLLDIRSYEHMANFDPLKCEISFIFDLPDKTTRS